MAKKVVSEKSPIIQTGYRLPLDLITKIRHAAVDRNITAASLVEEALSEWIVKHIGDGVLGGKR